MEIKFGHGALCDSYEQQANRQGFTLGDKEELFDKVKYSYNFLWVHGYLTDSQADTICKKNTETNYKEFEAVEINLEQSTPKTLRTVRERLQI